MWYYKVRTFSDSKRNWRSWSPLPPPVLQPPCSTTSWQSLKGSSLQTAHHHPDHGRVRGAAQGQLNRHSTYFPIIAVVNLVLAYTILIHPMALYTSAKHVPALAFTCLVRVNLPGISQSPGQLHSHSSPATFCMAWGTSLLSYLSSNMKEVDSISLKPIPIL